MGVCRAGIDIQQRAPLADAVVVETDVIVVFTYGFVAKFWGAFLGPLPRLCVPQSVRFLEERTTLNLL